MDTITIKRSEFNSKSKNLYFRLEGAYKKYELYEKRYKLKRIELKHSKIEIKTYSIFDKENKKILITQNTKFEFHNLSLQNLLIKLWLYKDNLDLKIDWFEKWIVKNNNNYKKLANALRKEMFIELYQDDIINNFKEHVEDRIWPDDISVIIKKKDKNCDVDDIHIRDLVKKIIYLFRKELQDENKTNYKKSNYVPYVLVSQIWDNTAQTEKGKGGYCYTKDPEKIEKYINKKILKIIKMTNFGITDYYLYKSIIKKDLLKDTWNNEIKTNDALKKIFFCLGFVDLEKSD